MINKKGAAFLTTIILLGITVISCSALSFMLLKDAFTVKRLKSSTQAYYLAEAGIEQSIQELWDGGFTSSVISSFPKTKTLGGGTISINLNTSKWSPDHILLITSTGTVNSISRIMKTEVKGNIPPSFDYTVLANGKIAVQGFGFIFGGGTVNCGTSRGIHSNSTAWGGLLTNAAVDVWGTAALVNGNASAVGRARERLWGEITGTILSSQPTVSLPTFDATFFDYYINIAEVVSGNPYVFSSDVTPENGVVYVNGSAKIDGGINITGCIIATGNIDVNPTTSNLITQTQVSGFPALMSRNGFIKISGPVYLNGLVYAAGEIKSTNWSNGYWGLPGQVTINGIIMSQGAVTTANRDVYNYAFQNPPGLGANPIGWILNWQED